MLLSEKSTQIKEHLSWEASINIKKKKKNLIRLHLPRFVYTRLHWSRLVFNSLNLSSDSSTLVYIRLDPSNDSSAVVCNRLVTRLQSSRLV